jgi:hypothetical protein
VVTQSRKLDQADAVSLSPYCAGLLFQVFLVEPLNFFPAGYGLTLLLVARA